MKTTKYIQNLYTYICLLPITGSLISIFTVLIMFYRKIHPDIYSVLYILIPMISHYFIFFLFLLIKKDAGLIVARRYKYLYPAFAIGVCISMLLYVFLY